MIFDTRGIVINHIKYGDSSIIVRIYTERFGLQSYMVKGVRKAKSRQHSACFEPLSLLEMQVYHKENTSLQMLKEVKVAHLYNSALQDFSKQSMLLFLSEVLSKTIKETGPDAVLFDFIFNALKIFDVSEQSCVDFHLVFMLELSRYLGFFPYQGDGKCSYFDMREGVFTTVCPPHQEILSGEHALALSGLVQHNFAEAQYCCVQPSYRRILLSALIDFYAIHVPDFLPIKSHKVLHEIMR